jgi:lipid-binding SYLF domain-containing protein
MRFLRFAINLFALALLMTAGQNKSFAEERSRGLASAVMGELSEAVGGTIKGVGETVKDVGTIVLGSDDAAAVKREIDENAARGLSKLLNLSESAQFLFDKSYAYAVFDSRKISILLTTGGGSGVVVEKQSGKRSYMHMATAGAGLGFGAQFFNVIFLFEDRDSMHRFVENGWEANAAASAVFGKNFLDANVRFVEGLAAFQLNEAGIMADLNLTGTRYWQAQELNK